MRVRQMQVKCPWDLDSEGKPLIESPENQWAIEYCESRGVPISYFQKPEKDDRVRSLASWLIGPRNFILILSNRSDLIWELYYYLAPTWAVTTKNGFYILDIKEFDTQDYKEVLPKVESANLLIIPYTDHTSYDLRRKKNILGNVLAKRKARKMPFVTDLFVKPMPSSQKDIITSIQPLANIFGESSTPMFLDKDSNAKIVRLES